MKTEIISIEPKWTNLMPLFFDWIRFGKKSQRETAQDEIKKLAKMIDFIKQAEKNNEIVIYKNGEFITKEINQNKKIINLLENEGLTCTYDLEDEKLHELSKTELEIVATKIQELLL